jgi:hypothetical protein
MALKEIPAGGRESLIEQNTLTGLFLQHPDGVVQGEMTPVAASGDGDSNLVVSYGQPFIITFVHSCAETSGVDVTDTILTAEWPFRILQFWAYLSDVTGTIKADTIQLLNGATAITDAMSINVDDLDMCGLVAGTSQIDEESAFIDTGDLLKVKWASTDDDHEIAYQGNILCARYTN